MENTATVTAYTIRRYGCTAWDTIEVKRSIRAARLRAEREQRNANRIAPGHMLIAEYSDGTSVRVD